MKEKKEETTKEDEKEKKTPQASWNLAEKMIEEVAGLLSKASQYSTEASLEGYDKSGHCLRAVGFRIVADLTDDEIKEMVRIENLFFLNINKARVGRLARQKPEQVKAYFMAYKLLGDYNHLIMKYLKKIGMLIPIKKKKIIVS